MQQMRQPKQSSKLKQIRYRKLTLAGGNTIVTYNSPGKTEAKGVFIQFPVIDNNNYEESTSQNPTHTFIDPKIYEDQVYKKSNYRAVKALMKVYEESNKKKSVDSMNMLGLDIKKINYEIPLKSNKQSLQKMNKISSHYSANPRSTHRQNSPLTTATSALISNNSKSKSMIEENCINRKRSSLISKDSETMKNSSSLLIADHILQSQFQNLDNCKQQIYSQYENSTEVNGIKLQLTDSGLFYRKTKIASRQGGSRELKKIEKNNGGRVPSLSARNGLQTKNYSVGANQGQTSPSKVKSQKKQQYLYEKLAGQEKVQRDQVNLVYDRRIRTFTDFLFKMQMSHGIYHNLDLKPEDLGSRGRRVKYYIGGGNNSAMIRGLIKRRYWWVPSQDKNQCCFIWTQIKVNQIFSKQKSVLECSKSIIKREIQAGSLSKKGSKKEEDALNQNNQQNSQNRNKTSKQRERSGKRSEIGKQTQGIQSISPQKTINGQKNLFVKNETFNSKLLNEEDEERYKQYCKRYEKNLIQGQIHGKDPSSSGNMRNYAYRVEKCHRQLMAIQFQDNIVHNHLQNNFYLGNKKALFYNLKQYYQLTKQNLFDYVPLTFHIKKGLKDPQYKRFITYYNRRKAIIKKQEKIEQEQGYLEKRKTRNIWIVKPGENTNQGRGITVIDQIYQLNNIMRGIGQSIAKNKQSKSPNKTNQCLGQGFQKQDQQDNGKRTFIVQMYIDRPMLYNNRKFDIRHYMLITNLYGITRAYWYAEGYIRTASYEFNIDNFEPEIHLTNDAIQKKYPQYGKYQPYNKISYEEFQRYLQSNYPTKKYNFKQQILPKMKKMATDAAKSVYTKIAPKNQMNNFQIFGLDFMVDKNFKPWLIQINTNPCLDCSCPLLDRIIPYMVQQSFKLSLDVVYPPPNHYPNTSKHFAPMMNLQNFKYELIFDSQVEGQFLSNLYKKTKGNLIDQIGDISDDEQFKDDGKEIKLDDFT